MKKYWLALLVLPFALLGVAAWYAWSVPSTQEQVAPSMDEAAVREVVTEFGYALKNVSLNASREESALAIREHYAELLSSELLEEWASDPNKAIGRYVSSPWPERIEINRVIMGTPTRYAVWGEVVEMTSVEETQGGESGRHRIELTVDKIGDRWVIIGAAEAREW